MTGDTSKRTRVLLMIGSMGGGGSERQTLFLLRHLDRDKFDVHLYLKRREGSLLDQVPNDVSIHVADDFAATNRIYWPGRIHGQEVRQLAQLLSDHHLDVVYDRTYHMSLIAGPACKIAGVSRVSTIVSPPAVAVPMVDQRFVGLKRRRLARAYRDSAIVLAVSRGAAASAVEYYGLPLEAIEVVPNSVDVDALQADVAGQEAIASDESRSRIVCVARMTKEKGHEDLIHALAVSGDRWPNESPPIELRLIGDGPLRLSVQDLANSVLKDSVHRVTFVGHVDRPAAEIAAADALIMPSLFEGMPNVVLEAMALRTPVIATRAGGTTEIQRDQPIVFWAQPNDPASLAEAIVLWASDDDRAAQYVDEAAKVIDQFHRVESTVRLVENRLRRAVEANSS